MKITVARLVEIVEGGVLTHLEAMKLPWGYRMACARFVEALLSEYKRFVQLRTQLIRTYGVADPIKGTIQIAHPDNTTSNIEAFHTGLADLLDTEVEITVPLLSAAQLSESDLTITDIRLLGPLLLEDTSTQ